MTARPPISIGQSGENSRTQVQNVGVNSTAVRGGRPEDAALRSITIDAARILGIDHRVGSLEVGKDGNFMITDGNPLHYMTHTRWTVVNGRVVYDKSREALYSHIRPDGDRDAPPPDDYWPRRLGDGQ